MLRAFSNVILERLRNIYNPLYPPYLKGDKKRILTLRRLPLLD